MKKSNTFIIQIKKIEDYWVVQTEQTSNVRKIKEAFSILSAPTIASTATPLSS
jgi:hypothetical protein